MSGVKEVYAPVMSKSAVDILLRNEVGAEYDKIVQVIMNRNGTGLCPMEQAVADIDVPTEALEAIEDTLEALKKRRE